MNRPIKFRAYDMEVPEMIHWEDRKTIRGKWDLDTVLDDDTFAVMQFTGLLDKNGVEIYEGDILAHADARLSSIEYDAPHFILRHHPEGGSDFPSPKNVFEIIGNIYENSDLLV